MNELTNRLSKTLVLKKQIILFSKDRISVYTDYTSAMQSVLIRTWCNHTVERPIVSLEYLDSGILYKVCNYFQIYSNHTPKPLTIPLYTENIDNPKNILDMVGYEYFEFLDLSKAELLDVINAANYLWIQHLLDICCIKFVIEGYSYNNLCNDIKRCCDKFITNL